MKQEPLMIVGTGLAGYTLARLWRQQGGQGPLVMVTQEAGASYPKPMLSAALSKGKQPDDLIQNSAEQMAETLQARILTHTQALKLDLGQRRLLLADESLPYHQAVLACGAQPKAITLDGSGAHQAMRVNRLSDYRVFRERIAAGGRIGIIGAGLIGCELAHDCVSAGYEVVLCHQADYPLEQLLPKPCGDVLRDALQDKGVDWHPQTVIRAIHEQGEAFLLEDEHGEVVAEVDHVLIAVGLESDTTLAQRSGLVCDAGVAVDAYGQTSDQHVYALGDCASIEGEQRFYVAALRHAAEAIAKTLNGQPTPIYFPPMPVVVKTPACPTVVCPPPQGAQGDWRMSGSDGDLVARFVSKHDRTLGFVAMGGCVSQRSALSREMV